MIIIHVVPHARSVGVPKVDPTVFKFGDSMSFSPLIQDVSSAFTHFSMHDLAGVPTLPGLRLLAIARCCVPHAYGFVVARRHEAESCRPHPVSVPRHRLLAVPTRRAPHPHCLAIARRHNLLTVRTECRRHHPARLCAPPPSGRTHPSQRSTPALSCPSSPT